MHCCSTLRRAVSVIQIRKWACPRRFTIPWRSLSPYSCAFFRETAETGIHAVALLLGVMYERSVLIQEKAGTEYALPEIGVVFSGGLLIVFVGQVFPFHRLVEGVGQEAAEQPVVGGRDEFEELSERAGE